MTHPLHVAICEDNPEDAAFLRSCVRDAGIPARCDSFESGEALLKAFRKGRWQLIFLDIYMPGITGIDVARAIRELDSGVVIAFTTTSEDHALDSYRVNALKYLLKPVSVCDVREALELARMKMRDEANRSIAILADGKRLELPLAAIYYVEAQNHSTLLHTDTTAYSTDMKIDDIELLLASPHFLRCHRSYIVNLDHVIEVDRDFIMENGATVYIRGKDLRRMREEWALYLCSQARQDTP